MYGNNQPTLTMQNQSNTIKNQSHTIKNQPNTTTIKQMLVFSYAKYTSPMNLYADMLPLGIHFFLPRRRDHRPRCVKEIAVLHHPTENIKYTNTLLTKVEM